MRSYHSFFAKYHIFLDSIISHHATKYNEFLFFISGISILLNNSVIWMFDKVSSQYCLNFPKKFFMFTKLANHKHKQTRHIKIRVKFFQNFFIQFIIHKKSRVLLKNSILFSIKKVTIINCFLQKLQKRLF